MICSSHKTTHKTEPNVLTNVCISW